jgi:hypothetical protein
VAAAVAADVAAAVAVGDDKDSLVAADEEETYRTSRRPIATTAPTLSESQLLPGMHIPPSDGRPNRFDPRHARTTLVLPCRVGTPDCRQQAANHPPSVPRHVAVGSGPRVHATLGATKSRIL